MFFDVRVRAKKIFVLILFLVAFAGCSREGAEVDVSRYQYRDTKNLVRFVYDAARVLRRDGMRSIGYFKAHREKYRRKSYYLYIYRKDGTNLFHAGMPELEGKNLSDLTDIQGKKINQMIVSAIEDTNNPHGWVHYMWWEPGKFYPVPKSSCNFEVVTAEGETLFVGGGISYPHEEREFIRIVVDDAVALLEKQGFAAIDTIASPVSAFNFRATRTFVFRPDGVPIISPVAGGKSVGINLLECADEIGFKPFADAVKKLSSTDRVWEVFMAKNQYQRAPVKKCLYIRRAVVGQDTVFVGAVTDLPQPPWI